MKPLAPTHIAARHTERSMPAQSLAAMRIRCPHTEAEGAANGVRKQRRDAYNINANASANTSTRTTC